MLPKQTYIARLGSFTPSGGNSITFAPGVRVKLKRLILAYTTAHATTTAVLTLQTRPIAGTAANETALGTLSTGATVALGTVLYHEFARPFGNVVASSASVPGGYIAATPDMPVVEAGGDFIVTSDGGGDNGVCNVFVEYEQEPFNIAVANRLDRVT